MGIDHFPVAFVKETQDLGQELYGMSKISRLF